MLGIVLTSVFVQLLDVSIVNVAIPSIQSDLGANSASIQLVLAGYQLAFACTLITAARLGDIRGRRRMFLIGMTVFTVASLLCGLAPEPKTLVPARVLQGLGSGLMFPQVLAVIQVTFSGKDRGKAFGIFGATIGLATILGPLIGGLLLKADLFGTDWRMIFLVNVPVGIGALVMAVKELPESKAPDAPRLDLKGAALVTVGLLLLVFPLTEGRERGWPWWIWVMLGLSLPVLAAFVALQLRKTRRDDDPLVLMSLFGNQSFQAGVVLSAVFFLGIAPFFFAFSLYLQVGLGFTPLHSGLTTLPFAIGSGLASARSDGIAKKLGRDVLLVGTLLSTAGMVALIVVLHLVGPDLHSYEVAAGAVRRRPRARAVRRTAVEHRPGRHLRPRDRQRLRRPVHAAAGRRGARRRPHRRHPVRPARQRRRPPRRAGASGGLRQQLLAAGVPAQGVGAAVGTFRDCFTRRAESGDPSVTPHGCEPRPGPAAAAFAAAGRTATAPDYQRAIERTLLFEVLVFGAAALLVAAPAEDPAQRARRPR